MVTDETMFALTVPEDGVSAEFVEGFEDANANAEVAISFLTLFFQGLSEQPMMVMTSPARRSRPFAGASWRS